jgi:hypothetical protein
MLKKISKTELIQGISKPCLGLKRLGLKRQRRVQDLNLYTCGRNTKLYH